MIHRLADCMNVNVPESTNIWQFCVVFPNCKIGENCNICSHCLIENDVGYSYTNGEGDLELRYMRIVNDMSAANAFKFLIDSPEEEKRTINALCRYEL